MQSSKKVFISFKSEEKDVAEKFKNAISSLGYNVWWSVNLQCGQEWQDEIDQAIKGAGAIVVIWSYKSYSSPWVRHEASQAMAMNIYSPVRIELINIETPYSTIQAADIIGWNGENNNLGFQNLAKRLRELMPPPVPFWKIWGQFFKRQMAAIIFSGIAIAALILLLKQRSVLGSQIQKQEQISRNVVNTEKLLNNTKDSLEIQITKVTTLNNRIDTNLRLALLNIDSQITSTKFIYGNMEAYSENQKKFSKTLDSTISEERKLLSQEEQSRQQILKAYYPLEPISIFYEREYSMEQRGFENYLGRVKKLIIKYFSRGNKNDSEIKFSDLNLTNVIIPAQDSSWFPVNNNEEYIANIFLQYDDYSDFTFKNNKGKLLTFSILPANESKSIFINLSAKTQLISKFQLEFNFTDKKIIQKIQCANPMKTGNNTTAISSIDLIANELSWGDSIRSVGMGESEIKIKSKITKIGLKFNNDYEYEGFKRYIIIPENSFSIIIKPSDIGLENLFP